ncbi:MAG: 4Fe-4S dicluster domain-containing protein [Gammaproteobacteria bacterium]|nr:MAG: 4Fe-4S dicluster domain-containing protein [Gammaproteobacteria bacterium]
MATVITDDCISCGACEIECPNGAISPGGTPYEFNGRTYPPLADNTYFIVPDKCTECVGHSGQEQCAAACPADCCVRDPNHVEAESTLLQRAKLLHPDHQFASLSAGTSHFRRSAAAIDV